MKLYDFALAPNPRRVRMFLAEKSVEIPVVQVNTREREQFQASFMEKNPLCTVPVLELDDGTCISESVAICRYIEELHPEPPLMGTDAKDKAIVEMWNRRCEFNGYVPAAEAVRNGLPMFADRGIAGMPGGVPQIPALVERGKQSLGRFFEMLDRQLADNAFIAGQALTIADITAFVTIEFAKRIEVALPESGTENLVRWHGEIAARPSAAA
ncbi:MAG: glutathione S-transferase [Gammaproteobacteria bacterium]|nr:glutathione S-transferase [Gammaproteobacteria bacterium]NIM75004.1 glutathione S-transferase [Gammaproteobacteria bacterium]NIN38475.1 glutathione S-transferase [Gammaproteobacteria bacterium]NIO23855.1 glutathione S-transferase [Gammaproteobacteria bacterium]NIO64497.1 glutathione S-transferase [Gammaproteobacteria bacterium]